MRSADLLTRETMVMPEDSTMDRGTERLIAAMSALVQWRGPWEPSTHRGGYRIAAADGTRCWTHEQQWVTPPVESIALTRWPDATSAVEAARIAIASLVTPLLPFGGGGLTWNEYRARKLRVLVTGSRDWADVRLIERVLAEVSCCMPAEHMTLVHGAARGADQQTADIARALGWRLEAHPADWDRLGRSAGYIRNQQMVDTRPDLCLAFSRNASKGTAHCISAARKAGIPTHVFEDDNAPRTPSA